MSNLKKLKEMSYKEAYEYFMESGKILSNDAEDYLMYIAREASVCDDIRGKSGIPKEVYKGGWLLVIDGPSCSGKSTMAKEIEKKFPETVDVFDIDEVLLDWGKKKMSEIPNKIDQIIFAATAEKMAIEYLKRNMESLIAARAKNGKTIVLVGCFLDFIYRSIIGVTLGKYFNKVVFFTIYEEEAKLREYQQKREMDYNNPSGEISPRQIAETSRQADFLKNTIELQLSALGLGADLSFLINNKTKLY